MAPEEALGQGGSSPVTVVIVELLGGAALAQCIDAVHALGLPAIVVDRNGWADGRRMGDAVPADVPSRRRRGADLATSPVVAFIEDTAVPCPGWAAEIATLLADGTGIAAVGGPVTIGPNLPSRAAALAVTEFGRFQPGSMGLRQPVDADTLPGVNFAFRRDTLLDVTSDTRRVVDQEVFAALRSRGWRLVMVPGMAVEYVHAFDEGAAVSTRYHHGRIYGAIQFAHASPLRRAIAASQAVALPLVLSLRALRLVPRGLVEPVRTRCWIVAQQTAWSVGELAGAVFGHAASKLARWN